MADEQFARDIAVMAVVFGVAAFVWFGWAQEDPPRRWRLPLGVGAGLGLLIAVIGGLLAWRLWGPDSVMADANTWRTFGIISGVEFGLAGLGAAALGITKRAKWIPAGSPSSLACTSFHWPSSSTTPASSGWPHYS